MKPPRAQAPLPVPFVAQRANLCGPAALAMVANYYGHAVTQDDIAQDIYLPDVHGTLTTELAAYATRFGFWVRPYRGSWADLEQKLAAGVPLIVLGKLGANVHYFVVLRAGDPLVVHTDRRPFHPMRREDFQRWWERTARWTLLVCPPAQATWTLSSAEHNDLGLFHERTGGDLPAAEAHYRQAIGLRPDNSYYQFNLGNALLGQAHFRDAVTAYQRAIELAPDNADALNNLAWTWHELGENLDQAAALCQRAVALNPAKRAYYLDTLGQILLKQGQRSEARAAFEQALAATGAGQDKLAEDIRRELQAIPPEDP